MKVSIVTVVYNNKDTICHAIDSVLGQTHDDIEYIIIDGDSTDGTIDIVKSYGDKISQFVSEPDSGIYDAMNKGIRLATGEIVGILNSDDFFEDEHTLAKIVAAFNVSNTDSVYGDLVYVRKDDLSSVVRYWKSSIFEVKKLKNGWMPPHPTFYVKREIYDKHGDFDASFKISADYDLVLRFLGSAGISTYHIPEVLVRMRVGGESNRSLKNIIRKTQEDGRAIIKNNAGNHLGIFLKNVRKVPQFARRRFQ